MVCKMWTRWNVTSMCMWRIACYGEAHLPLSLMNPSIQKITCTMQLSKSFWQRLTRWISLKKSKFGELKRRVIFLNLVPRLTQAPNMLLWRVKTVLKRMNWKRTIWRKWKWNMAPQIKVCYLSIREVGNIVSLTDMGMSCPFWIPPIGQQNILWPSISLL